MVSSKFIKVFLAIIIGGVVLSSCSNSDQKKASNLIMEHARTTIADYESFEIVQMDTIKEVYSNVYEEQELSNLYNAYYYYLDSISNMNQSIQYLNSYIKDNTPVLNDLTRRKDAAYYRYYQLFLSGNLGNSFINASNDYQYLKDEEERLSNEISKAKTMRKRYQQSVNNCNDALSVFCQNTIDFYNNYEPQYLGLGTIVKCRYKGENSNMMFATYKVIFNDDISEILSIKYVDADSYQNIKAFVDKLVN